MRKIDKHYVSDIDKKLAEFDAANPKSRAQQAEYDKYQKIYRMRDEVSNTHLETEDLFK
jgi:hypothetical protein